MYLRESNHRKEEPKLSGKNAWLGNTFWLAAVAIVLLFAVHLLYTGLGGYSDSYDAGVYLESARMMGRGFAPYRQIFVSQPPLWFPLIHFAFRLFGETFLAGQLVTATAGLIAITAVMLITKQLGGSASSILAGTLVTFSPVEFEWSRLINADVPSVALTAVGMVLAARYARKGRRGWLVAASVAIVGSILVKLLGLYAVPSLFLFVIARWVHARDINRRQRLRFIGQDFLIIFGIFVGITLLTLALVRSDQVWNQVITFHWAGRKVYPSGSLSEKWRALTQLLVGERLLLMLGWLAALCLLGGADGLAILAWPCFALLGLLNQRPLFDHHMVALIPALAAAIGVGAGYLGFIYALFLRWFSRQIRPIRITIGTVSVIAGLAFLGAGAGQAWIELADQQKFRRGSAVPSPDLRAAELVVKNTNPGDMIITDAQGIAFLADRDVPPSLTDTSYLRINSGYLQPQQVIDQAEVFHVRLVLLWSWRLSLMPEVVRWADKRFPHRVDLGSERVLYFQ